MSQLEEERWRSRGFTISLVSPNELLRIDPDTEDPDMQRGFEGTLHRVSDYGDIQLAGTRYNKSADRSYKAQGIALRSNTTDFQVQDIKKMEEDQKDLFELEVIIYPGVGKNGVLCIMTIAGHDGGFYTHFISFDERYEDSFATTDPIWKSLDTTDSNNYALMASPQDTELLSKLEFHFF